MDTKREIDRDKWVQAHYGMCETCSYVKRSKNGKYYCNNEELEQYGMYSEDIESCDDYSLKKGVLL